MAYNLTTLAGGGTTIGEESVQAFSDSLRGQLVRPGKREL